MRGHQRQRPSGSLVVYVSLLLLGIVIAALLLPARVGRLAGGVQEVDAFNDGAIGYTNEDRAMLSEIFIGAVIDRKPDEDIAEPGSEPFLVPAYTVDVETTLKGGAADRVTVTFIENELVDPEIGTLRVGQRYLFAATGPDESVPSYTADAGLGNLPIADDEEAAALIAEFERILADPPLIAASTNPCEEISTEPSLTISPKRGKPGTNVRVEVANVVPSDVGIWWRNLNNRVGLATVRSDCAAVDVIKVPNDANPGRYNIIVMDARGLEAQAVFEVTN